MKIPSLSRAVAWLEDSIIVISGPALAISGIIAGVDLVTGGNVLKSVSWLALVWAITLLLTLDFQVLALGVRAHRVYTSQKRLAQKAIEIALAVIIAAAISYVSIQMQSIIARVNAENVTIDQAAAQLGINTVALIWERSTLVLVLIFMSGWLRHSEQAEVQAVQPTDAAISELAQQMERLAASMVQVTTTVERVSTTVTQITLGEHPAIVAREQPLQIEGPTSAANDQQVYEPIALDRFQSKEQVIAAILARSPDASVEQVMQEAACSERTAQKWMQKRTAERK